MMIKESRKPRYVYSDYLCFPLQLNCGSVGMYRVQYTSQMLDALIPAVRDRTLPPRDRLGLENDLFALV